MWSPGLCNNADLQQNAFLYHHFSKCSGVNQPRHWGDASFDLAHPILVDRASLPPPSFNPDRLSFWRDDWRSVALSSLEVAPGVTPRVPALFDLPSSACRATAPSDFAVRGERGSPVQKFHCYFWVTARERDWRPWSKPSPQPLRNGRVPVVIIPPLPFSSYREPSHAPPHGSIV